MDDCGLARVYKRYTHKILKKKKNKENEIFLGNIQNFHEEMPQGDKWVPLSTKSPKQRRPSIPMSKMHTSRVI